MPVYHNGVLLTQEEYNSYRKVLAPAPAKLKGTGKPFTLISPEGKIVKCGSAYNCSKITGVSYASLSKLRSGLCKSAKGWRLFAK